MTSFSRRSFLGRAGLATAGLCLTRRVWANSPSASVRPQSQWKLRPDLLDGNSLKGVEVFQLTTEQDVPGSHLYMEAQIFTPDSKRLVLHRSASAHGGSKSDPKHHYLLCDLENHGALHPLAEEPGNTAMSVSPDGKYAYYFVDKTEIGGGMLTLKRVNLDGADRQTVMVVDAVLPGTKFRPSKLYPLSTISSDGRRMSISCFLGDGNIEPIWGMMVFDVEKASVRLIIQGQSWCNMHPQYCRSTDPEASHDILIQENHDNVFTPKGEMIKLVGGVGADIHVIRDDGSNFRNMPWGRDGNEACQGHQCWRGQSIWAITSTGSRKPPEAQLIEGRAAAHAGHVGIKTSGGVRNDLSREFPNPHFYHFSTDIAGKRLISDAAPLDKGGRLYLGELGEPGKDPVRNWKCLLNPRCSCKKQAHIHPFLSPDGSMGFFNSDESGILQAYMIRGF
ncbi:MAG: hypothetical protein PHR77_15845 [Kiritimatiellae bacterium]|nr:hypothetical protein [Kiritimatiellia bacterium]